jgi:formylglycine-generating enzyme required for sulfatase activity
MGDERESNETISQPYRIGRYPVTNAQFTAFVAAGGYEQQRYWREAQEAGVWQHGEVKTHLDDEPRKTPYDYGEPFNLHNYPVVGVTWYEAVAFSRWLTEQLRQVGGLASEIEIVLPNEPQWEKAARGTDGRVYPWGDEADPDRANYGDTGIGTTSAVGCFPSGMSPYGVEDLSGNVWEWTCSLYASYPYDPEDGRENLEAGSYDSRVVRGGAFDYNVRLVRCASRGWNYPDVRFRIYGFRVVASPVGEA